MDVDFMLHDSLEVGLSTMNLRAHTQGKCLGRPAQADPSQVGR
jgi:hypothetical protein